MAYLARSCPPPGTLIKVVAVARSDEHVFILDGGPANRKGQRLGSLGGYRLNEEGRPHGAAFAEETAVLNVYRGEPDDVQEYEVIDAASEIPAIGLFPFGRSGRDTQSRGAIGARSRARAVRDARTPRRSGGRPGKRYFTTTSLNAGYVE